MFRVFRDFRRLTSRRFHTAFITLLAVPVIALFLWEMEPVIPVARVFGANGFFAVLFVGTALLFGHAAQSGPAGRTTNLH